MENELSYTKAMTEEEKMVFLKALVKLAKADNNFDDNEKDFIRGMGIMFNLPKSVIPKLAETISDDEFLKQLKVIKDRRLAMDLVKEMCMLANFDGDMSGEEIILIGKAGEAMGLSLEKIQDISQWVIDRIILQERGKIIFEKF